MRILIVSSYLPYPLYDGGSVRLYNVVKSLHELGHEVHLVCEIRSHQSDNDIDALKQYCQSITCIQRKLQWTISNVLKAAFSMRSFLSVGHDLPMMRSAIASILETERPDVIHVETFYVLQNVPQTRVPIVCIEHNIEWSVYDKHASRAPFFLRPLLWWDARKIEREERNAWKRSRAVVAVSEYEKSQIDADQVGYAPNGFSPEDFPYVDPTHKSTNAPTVLFMGNFKWVQNRDACAYLLTRLWPRVKKKWKNTYPLKLWIVGKHIPASIRQLYTQDDVVYDEHAPDKTSDIYLRSTVLLSPLFVGGGSSYKIIEAMASGVPVVTTPLGMQGLGAKENVHMLVGDNPDTLADHVVTLLTHPEVYTSVSKQAKRFIHAHFSWKEIAKSLQAVYKQVGDTN